jgi:hypothetical protein
MTAFAVRTVTPEQLGSPGVGLADIHAGRVGGLLVRGVVPTEDALAAAARLEAGHGFDTHRLGVTFTGWSLGLGLDLAAPDLRDYLAGVPRSAEAAEAAGLRPLWDAVDGALAALAGPRPLARVTAPDGRPYLDMGVRRLPPGGLIPPHSENEQTGRAPSWHVATLIDRVTLMSFFLVLRPASSGGELVVHDMQHDDLDPGSMHKGRSRVGDRLAGRARWPLRPEAGDLLVFDGGRHIHEVASVGGQTDRWTAGGFLSVSRDGDRVLRWS